MSTDGRKDASADYLRLIPFLLGLRSTLDDISERLLAQSSPARNAGPGIDERVVYAALGIVSLRRSLDRWMSHAGSGEDDARAKEDAASGDATGAAGGEST